MDGGQHFVPRRLRQHPLFSQPCGRIQSRSLGLRMRERAAAGLLARREGDVFARLLAHAFCDFIQAARERSHSRIVIGNAQDHGLLGLQRIGNEGESWPEGRRLPSHHSL
jgi:hypothetical protein